jgi:hypothetical protein
MASPRRRPSREDLARGLIVLASMGTVRLSLCVWITLAACGGTKGGNVDVDAPPEPADACTDHLSCFVVDCGAKGLPPTSISGKVFAPNGTLPLYGVRVYVPASDPGPLPAGVQCDRCSTELPGGAIASTSTDEAGEFRLDNVPATTDVPVVIQVGKWRRQFTLPAVAACQDTTMAKANTTLPRTRAEGDLPKIAITTGNADALECLVRKLGVDDSEFGTAGDDRAVHLYNGNGANKFAVGFAGGSGDFAPALAFWDSRQTLDTYDTAMLSCEADQFIGGGGGGGGAAINAKPQSSLDAIHGYANAGGRVFLSHWHNVWIGGNRQSPGSDYGIAEWKPIIDWDFGAAQPDATQLTVIDETVPKGMEFATWMLNVEGSTVRGEVQVSAPRYTARGNDPTRSDRYVFVDPARSTPAGRQGVQDVLFTTPVGVSGDQRCGKVVFSDMHVASGSTSRAATPFPGGCNTGDLTPQEKALAFIFFDIASCVAVLE